MDNPLEADLLARKRDRECQLWYSLFPSDRAPLGANALGPDPRPLPTHVPNDTGTEIRPPGAGGRAVPGERPAARVPPGGGETLGGLEVVCAGFLAKGIPAHVIRVMLSSRTKGTYANYDGNRNKFTHYCAEHGYDPWTTDIGLIMSFLDDQWTTLYWGGSTLRGCVAALSFFGGKIDGKSVFMHNLLAQYLTGTRYLAERAQPRYEVGDASPVLRALQGAPFEPMPAADMACVTAKPAVLLALTTAA